MRTFGKNGRRKFCCTAVRLCHGKKCRDVNRKCSFVGPSFITKERVRCHWVRKNGHSKQNKCCTFIKRCKVSGKVKKL